MADNNKVRGKRKAEYVVLKGSPEIHSVLVETGFLTNEEDRARLISQQGQEKAAESIFKGIIGTLN